MSFTQGLCLAVARARRLCPALDAFVIESTGGTLPLSVSVVPFRESLVENIS